MKDVIKNVCAIILFLLSVATTIVMAKFASCEWYTLLLYQISICVGICCIRFAYAFAQIHLFSLMYKWSNSDDYDEEPSPYGVLVVKLVGCFLLFFPIIVYAIFA